MQPTRRARLLISSVLVTLAPTRAHASEVQSIMDDWFREIGMYVGSVVLVVLAFVVLRRLVRRWRAKAKGRRA